MHICNLWQNTLILIATEFQAAWCKTKDRDRNYFFTLGIMCQKENYGAKL